MDPATILALASTVSNLFGTASAQGAKDKTLALQEQQLAQQQALQQQQMALANEMARRGIATQIDANGNVTAYDQASNTWKTVLAPTQQKLQNLSDAEQTNQLSVDAPMSRLENIVNANRRSQEAVAANGAAGNLQTALTHPVSANDLASALRLSRTDAVNKGFDQVSASLGTQALRAGAAGGGALAGVLAKQRAQAIAQTMGTPSVEGMQTADQINQGRVGAAGSLYNLLAGRASGAPQTSFGPTNTAGALATALTNSRALANNASGQQGNLLSQAINSIDGQKTPNYVGGSDASLYSGLGTLLSSASGNSGVTSFLSSLFGGGGTKKTTAANGASASDWMTN